MSGLISRRLPVPSLTKVKESRPRLRPVAMLNVSGVATSVRKAGKASLKSSQRTRSSKTLLSFAARRKDIRLGPN